MTRALIIMPLYFIGALAWIVADKMGMIELHKEYLG